MEPSYSVWADALAKFQNASDPIQALCILALAATIFGMVWCVTRLIRDITVAILHRSARCHGPAPYDATRDPEGRWRLHGRAMPPVISGRARR
ncbi:hypothetical protein [Microvirga pudoricolor]|uniref:hypothetical protein n=1 Tax=Microvirga pudoricolor TaxID=2778729 RepID=UPI001951A2CC|nr:hypothetical protein [Microvirga pudoricolor]MBM6593036.1 hypothetical protein [Microvirga pudoricolor]